MDAVVHWCTPLPAAPVRDQKMAINQFRCVCHINGTGQRVYWLLLFFFSLVHWGKYNEGEWFHRNSNYNIVLEYIDCIWSIERVRAVNKKPSLTRSNKFVRILRAKCSIPSKHTHPKWMCCWQRERAKKKHTQNPIRIAGLGVFNIEQNSSSTLCRIIFKGK